MPKSAGASGQSLLHVGGTGHELCSSLTGNPVARKIVTERAMPQVCYYNPAERQLEKEHQRQLDAAQLHVGQVSADELKKRNGFFSSLEIVHASVACEEVFA